MYVRANDLCFQGSDTLRHVDAEEKKQRSSSTDNRGDLLDQIRFKSIKNLKLNIALFVLKIKHIVELWNPEVRNPESPEIRTLCHPDFST